MYGVPIINRSLTIEVKLTSNSAGQTFQFPDNQIIRGQSVTVYAIEAFTRTQCTKSPSSLDVVTQAGATGLSVTFQDNSSINRVYEIPYYTLLAYLNGGFIREFKPFKCVLSKSFVKILDGANITANDVAFFNIVYKTN
jgi:hypothetical protein